ncbi:MAG TPA: hypothetical protein VFB72_11715, partial [Verrucomicrobiae bacterium]|nr:hypothetical protein [Verrucomicrobiae bacterium]
SVGLDTIKVFVARNLKSLSSFSEVASYAIGRSSGDRRKRGDAILQQLRDAVGLPKSIEQLRCNLTKVNPDMLKHGAIDDAEEIYEFGRKNRIKDMDKSWLRRRLTPQEETALYSRARTGIPPGPFVTHLRNFLAHRVDRDELWEFGTSDESWKILAGRAGIAIVRNGEVFDRLTTHLN